MAEGKAYCSKTRAADVVLAGNMQCLLARRKNMQQGVGWGEVGGGLLGWSIIWGKGISRIVISKLGASKPPPIQAVSY